VCQIQEAMEEIRSCSPSRRSRQPTGEDEEEEEEEEEEQEKIKRQTCCRLDIGVESYAKKLYFQA